MKVDRKKRYFIKDGYYGADGERFQEEFCAYLMEILKNTRFEAMSEHQIFLQGGEQAIKEIVAEMSI